MKETIVYNVPVTTYEVTVKRRGDGVIEGIHYTTTTVPAFDLVATVIEVAKQDDCYMGHTVHKIETTLIKVD